MILPGSSAQALVNRKQPQALIIGGSVAGLFSALLLRRQGWRVDVFERTAGELTGRGAGIVTHQSLFDILDLAGVTIAPADLGTAVEGRSVFDNTGAIVAQMELKQILTSWGRLHSILRRLLPVGVLPP